MKEAANKPKCKGCRVNQPFCTGAVAQEQPSQPRPRPDKAHIPAQRKHPHSARAVTPDPVPDASWVSVKAMRPTPKLGLARPPPTPATPGHSAYMVHAPNPCKPFQVVSGVACWAGTGAWAASAVVEAFPEASAACRGLAWSGGSSASWLGGPWEGWWGRWNDREWVWSFSVGAPSSDCTGLTCAARPAALHRINRHTTTMMEAGSSEQNYKL